MSKFALRFMPRKRFGEMFYYPRCTLSQAICTIAHKRSLSERDFKILKEMHIQLFLEEKPLTA